MSDQGKDELMALLLATLFVLVPTFTIWSRGMSEPSRSEFVALILAILLCFLIVVGPIFTIWSINTLFMSGEPKIPYSFKTCVAMLWLITVFNGIRITMPKKE